MHVNRSSLCNLYLLPAQYISLKITNLFLDVYFTDSNPSFQVAMDNWRFEIAKRRDLKYLSVCDGTVLRKHERVRIKTKKVKEHRFASANRKIAHSF